MTQAMVARKPLTLLGRRYARNERVDFTGVKPELRRRLVEQKRVVPRAAGTAASPASPHPTQQATQSVGARCGEHGGKMKNGQPCGRITHGLCQHHKPKEA